MKPLLIQKFGLIISMHYKLLLTDKERCRDLALNKIQISDGIIVNTYSKSFEHR